MGWLHATPKSKSEKSKEDRKVRARTLPRNSVYFKMPEVGIGKYIVDLWNEVGECKQGGMSIVPIDWADLAAFKEFSGINKHEAHAIISMSKEYVAAINRYEEPNSPAPYCQSKALAKQQNRDKVAMQFKALKQSRKAAQ